MIDYEKLITLVNRMQPNPTPQIALPYEFDAKGAVVADTCPLCVESLPHILVNEKNPVYVAFSCHPRHCVHLFCLSAWYHYTTENRKDFKCFCGCGTWEFNLVLSYDAWIVNCIHMLDEIRREADFIDKGMKRLFDVFLQDIMDFHAKKSSYADEFVSIEKKRLNKVIDQYEHINLVNLEAMENVLDIFEEKTQIPLRFDFHRQFYKMPWITCKQHIVLQAKLQDPNN